MDVCSAGAEAFVVGHAAWSSHYRLNPTVTTGVVSKVVTHLNSPVLIQVIHFTNSPVGLLTDIRFTGNRF